ncbi:MAG: hypothetical protein ABI835_04365, partial [Chloroflexota bacterium]
IIAPARWLPRLADLPERRIAMFSASQLVVDLNRLGFRPLQAASPAPYYGVYATGDTSLPALFEHAPTEVEYLLYLPSSYPYAEFTALLAFDSENGAGDTPTAQAGIVFSVSVMDEAWQIQHSSGMPVVPQVSSDSVPFRYDLSTYRGQRIRLRLRVDALAAGTAGWGLWVRPTIRLSDTDSQS